MDTEAIKISLLTDVDIHACINNLGLSTYFYVRSSKDHFYLDFKDVGAVVDFMVNTLQDTPNFTEDLIIKNTKFFYLLTSVAVLIEDELVNNGLLYFKNSPIHRASFMSISIEVPADANIKLVLNLEANCFDQLNRFEKKFLTLVLSRYFDYPLDFNAEVTLKASVAVNFNLVESKTTAKISDITKNMINKLFKELD